MSILLRLSRTCSPPDYNTMISLCDTFITSHFFFSLSLCRPSPPSVYPHPLCPFLTLSFSFIPSLITPPLLRPVRPSSGLQLFQPLLLHILFQGLKPSQTISSGVFCTKGQRKWGEVCWVHMMWWNSEGLQVPFSSNANMLIEFLFHFLALSFDLQHHCWGFAWLRKGNDVFIWSEIFCLLSLWAWKTSERL